jgi:hypothetical protein
MSLATCHCGVVLLSAILWELREPSRLQTGDQGTDVWFQARQSPDRSRETASKPPNWYSGRKVGSPENARPVRQADHKRTFISELTNAWSHKSNRHITLPLGQLYCTFHFLIRTNTRHICRIIKMHCTVSACDVRAATLSEVFPCFFLSCKANARV